MQLLLKQSMLAVIADRLSVKSQSIFLKRTLQLTEATQI